MDRAVAQSLNSVSCVDTAQFHSCEHASSPRRKLFPTRGDSVIYGISDWPVPELEPSLSPTLHLTMSYHFLEIKLSAPCVSPGSLYLPSHSDYRSPSSHERPPLTTSRSVVIHSTYSRWTPQRNHAGMSTWTTSTMPLSTLPREQAI